MGTVVEVMLFGLSKLLCSAKYSNELQKIKPEDQATEGFEGPWQSQLSQLSEYLDSI